MTTIRRGLRLWVSAWLVVQAASMAALVPRECCAAHRAAAIEKPRSCHLPVAATQCPMRAADGTPCPMHREGHSDEHSTVRCTMRSTCSGPMAALLASLSHQGVLTARFLLLPDLQVTAAAPSPRESLISPLLPPDSPPPRA